MKKKALIVGAGPAGLTAGRELVSKSDISVEIFEESSYVGGISKTVRYNGNRIDIGGHRFFSKNDEIMSWWQDLMPLQGALAKDKILLKQEQNDLNPNGPDPEKEDIVLLMRQRVSRIFYLKKFFNYPISLSFETLKNMGFSRTMKAGFGYIGVSIHKREENNLEDFYINRFGKPLYKMFFENYTEKVWGVHPSKLGADWGAQRVKGLSLMGILKDIITKPFKKKDTSIDQKEVETSLIERFLYPKYGPGHLWETVAELVQKEGGDIQMNTCVKKIKIQDQRVVSAIVSKDGVKSEVECDYLLSTMPIKDLIASIEGIEVPSEIKDIAANLPYRDFITVGLLVDKLLIENKTDIMTWNNIVPDTWIYIQESDVKIGRLQIFNNWSPYMVEDFENKVWIGLEYFANEGDELWEMEDDAFIKFAIAELDKIGIITKDDVRDAVRIKVKKAYPSYYGSYSEFPKVVEFLDKIENLYCMGRNGQHRYNNMDHSMLTAIETVNHITGKIKDKKIIWDVNTEEEYHEKK